MSQAAALRHQLEAAIGGTLAIAPRPEPELLPTGIREVDARAGGLPRGALTEICGPASSGRTSLMLSIMARATELGEICALIDTSGAFDPASAASVGVHLDRVLWVRCGGNAETALKAADLIVQGGGFGLVAMDSGNTPPEVARRVSMTSWFRLRRAVEHTRTVLVAVEREPHAKSCASLVLELRRAETRWSGTPGCSQLLRGLRVDVERRKPAGAPPASFEAGSG